MRKARSGDLECSNIFLEIVDEKVVIKMIRDCLRKVESGTHDKIINYYTNVWRL